MDKQSQDTIRIELVVLAALDYEDGVCMHGQLKIYINQRQPYDESSDIIDEHLLFDSMSKNGEYFIFSCCCGIPSCSGWDKGIKVIHRESQLEWTDLNKNKSWIFEKSSIENQLKAIKEEVVFYKEYFRNKGIDYVGVGYAW